MAVAHTRSGPLTIVGAPRYLHRGVVFVYPKSLDISKGQMVDPSPWQVCQQEISVKTNVQHAAFVLFVLYKYKCF